MSVNDENGRLLESVNSSAAMVQFALGREVQNPAAALPWEILTRDYLWRDPESGKKRSIDLVLQYQRDVVSRLAVACMHGREWVFLVPEESGAAERARCYGVTDRGEDPPRFGWYDFPLEPRSIESEFCLAQALERSARRLIQGTEFLASQEAVLATSHFRHRIFIPAIVTSARLLCCRLKSGARSIDRGAVDVGDPRFEEVPYLRFRKSLSITSITDTEEAPPRDFRERMDLNARTVMVVNSGGIADFLRACHIGEFSPNHPWHRGRTF